MISLQERLLNSTLKQIYILNYSRKHKTRLISDDRLRKKTFYNLFENKTEFLYQVMIYKRRESKDKIFDFLDHDGKLSRSGLYSYLRWLADENPNIFSYLDGQHTRWLISKWPPEYLENEENDEQTARRIISFLATPKDNPDWKLFCNYLKLLALTLNSKDYLIIDATENLINNLITDVCNCISL